MLMLVGSGEGYVLVFWRRVGMIIRYWDGVVG
jgi:hypothetical protein